MTRQSKWTFVWTLCHRGAKTVSSVHSSVPRYDQPPPPPLPVTYQPRPAERTQPMLVPANPYHTAEIPDWLQVYARAPLKWAPLSAADDDHSSDRLVNDQSEFDLNPHLNQAGHKEVECVCVGGVQYVDWLQDDNQRQTRWWRDFRSVRHLVVLSVYGELLHFPALFKLSSETSF